MNEIIKYRREITLTFQLPKYHNNKHGRRRMSTDIFQKREFQRKKKKARIATGKKRLAGSHTAHYELHTGNMCKQCQLTVRAYRRMPDIHARITSLFFLPLGGEKQKNRCKDFIARYCTSDSIISATFKFLVILMLFFIFYLKKLKIKFWIDLVFLFNRILKMQLLK